MSLSKTWGYGSNSSAAAGLTVSSINPIADFGLVEDEPTACGYKSMASTLDCREKLTYQCRDIANTVSSLGTYPNPALSKSEKQGMDGSVEYGVKLEDQLKITSSDDPTYREILPVVAEIKFRHPKNGNIASADIDVLFARLVGACLKSVSGTISTRFSDIMLSGLKATADGSPVSS